jgi:RND family efflux transporter MFP subunit
MKSKRILIISLSALALIAIGSLFFIFRAKAPAYNFMAIKQGDVKQEVKATGVVKAAEEVDLAFERPGKLSKIYVKTGDPVKVGQRLAELSAADVAAQLQQAQAAYTTQTVLLRQLQNGSRPEDMAISQTKVASAQASLADVQSKAAVDLNNLYAKTADVINDAYAKAFDAVNNKVSDLFTDVLDSPSVTFLNTNSELENTVRQERAAARDDLSAWKIDIDTLASDPAASDAQLVEANKKLASLTIFVKNTSNLLDYAIVSSNLSSVNLNTYKSNASLALSEANQALSSINNQTQSLSALKSLNNNLLTQAQNNLTAAQSELKLKQAGATKDQIDAQSAVVASAAANVAAYQAQLGKAVLVSPLDGVVSRQDGHEGELVGSAPLISLLSNSKFQIEAQLPEEGLGQVQIGQAATVTLDAYGSSREFTAKVIALDSASSGTGGIASYKVTLEFDQPDTALKSGLTANIRILVGEHQGALLVPSSAILKEGLKDFVIVDDGTSAGAKREVTPGLAGSDGFTEILSGLTASDRIAVFSNNN